MDHTSSTSPPRRGAHAALWLIAVGLLANAAIMVWNHQNNTLPAFIVGDSAMARTAGQRRMLGANGIYMMPGRLGPRQWGVYLMDLDSNTLCVYEALPDTSRIKLMAVRNFQYDRFLTDMNNESPTPRQVKKLVEQQRLRRQQARVNKKIGK